MKPVTVTKFEAADGRQFDTEAECKAHERESAPMRLVGLTIEQVQSAMRRDDTDLAEAIEECGRKIALTRREAGEYKRRRKGETVAALSGPGPGGAPDGGVVVDAAGREVVAGDGAEAA